MIRFTQKVKTTLVFEFVVKGLVKESDLIGALLTLTSSIHPDYNITKLQNNQKIGKTVFTILQMGQKETTRGLLQIPCSLDEVESSILCAIIETINKVGIFNATIKLKEVQYSEKSNYQKILKRSLELYRTYFSGQSEGDQAVDLKKALLELTSSSKAIQIGTFTIGSSFYDSSSIIVLEGRKDVLLLGACGISNTFALGGYDFEADSVIELLKNKELTLFLDGDRGGEAIKKKVHTLGLSIKYQIDTPEGISVEDLKKSQVFNLIKTRRLL